MFQVFHVFHSVMYHGYRNITLNHQTCRRTCEGAVSWFNSQLTHSLPSSTWICRHNSKEQPRSVRLQDTICSDYTDFTRRTPYHFNQTHTIRYVFNGSFLHTTKWLTRTRITFLGRTTSLTTTWIQMAEKFTSANEETDYSLLEQKENCYCNQCHLWKSRDLTSNIKGWKWHSQRNETENKTEQGYLGGILQSLFLKT
jgi:hypothetical protein